MVLESFDQMKPIIIIISNRFVVAHSSMLAAYHIFYVVLVFSFLLVMLSRLWLPTDTKVKDSKTLEGYFYHHTPEFFTDSPHDFEIMVQGNDYFFFCSNNTQKFWGSLKFWKNKKSGMGKSDFFVTVYNKYINMNAFISVLNIWFLT